MSGREDFWEEFSAQLNPEGRGESGKDGSRKECPGKGESMLRITHRRVKEAHKQIANTSVWPDCKCAGGEGKGNRRNNDENGKVA